MTMSATKATKQPSRLGGKPCKPNVLPTRPIAERNPSSYSTSSRARAPGAPGTNPTKPGPSNRESYFSSARDHCDDEDPGPPEITETSVGATVRLVYRYQELQDVVAMWTEFRQGISKSEESDWLAAHYINEFSRSFNLLRRAYHDVQQMRHYGYGTEQRTSLETNISTVLEKVEDWRNKNLDPQTRPDWARQRPPGPSTAASAPMTPISSNGPSNNSLVVYRGPAGTGNPKTPSASPLHPTSQPAGPTREEVFTRIRKMTTYMDCISNVVQACPLSREQMQSGLYKMRQELLKLQREAIELLKQDAEQERAQTAGESTQPSRRN